MPYYPVSAALSKLDDQPKKFTLYMATTNPRDVELVIGVKADKKKVADTLRVAKIDKKYIGASGKCYKEGNTVVFKGRMQNGGAKSTISRLCGSQREVVFRDPAPGELLEDPDDELGEEEGDRMGDDAAPPAQPNGNANPVPPSQASNPAPLNRSNTFGQGGPTVPPARPVPATPTPPPVSSGNQAPPSPMRSGTLGAQGAPTPPPRPATPSPMTATTPPVPVQATQPTPTAPPTATQPRPPRQPPALKPGQDPALQPPMPDPPTLAWLRSFDAPKTPKKEMKKKFSKEKMKSIKDETDRGFFKGMGDFKSVFSGVEDLQASEQKIDDFIAAKGEAARPQLVAKLIEKYDALIQKIEKYQSNFADDGTAVNFGRTKRSQGSSAIRDTKLAFSEEARQAALEARAQLQLPNEFAAMSALSQRATQGTLTVADEQSYHQTRADFLMKAGGNDGVAKASGGTSDTQLIRGFNGNVAYAFKSIDGESDQMNAAKGAGTAREVLTSRVAEVIKLQSELDLGFPKTTLASLPMPNGTGGTQNRTGALIEGLPGQPIADVSIEFAEAEWGKMGDAEKADVEARCKADPTVGWSAGMEDTYYGQLLKKEQRQLIAAVPPEAVQKILVMNFLSASADSKWSNVMIDGTSAAPFDGGGCMMSPQELKAVAKAPRDDQARGIKSGDIDPAFGLDMLYIPNGGGEHPAANAPLSADLVAGIRKINPDQLETEMKAETQRLRNLDGRIGNAVDNSGAAASAESTRRMKRALENAIAAASAQNRLPTTKEFVNAYNDEMRAWLTTVT